MIFANEQTVIFGDPTILHNEQYSYIGDPMIGANEQVKMWGSKVFILDNIEFALFDGINKDFKATVGWSNILVSPLSKICIGI